MEIVPTIGTAWYTIISQRPNYFTFFTIPALIINKQIVELLFPPNQETIESFFHKIKKSLTVHSISWPGFGSNVVLYTNLIHSSAIFTYTSNLINVNKEYHDVI